MLTVWQQVGWCNAEVNQVKQARVFIAHQDILQFYVIMNEAQLMQWPYSFNLHK